MPVFMNVSMQICIQYIERVNRCTVYVESVGACVASASRALNHASLPVSV